MTQALAMTWASMFYALPIIQHIIKYENYQDYLFECKLFQHRISRYLRITQALIRNVKITLTDNDAADVCSLASQGIYQHSENVMNMCH